jgi:hypothetical protein
MKKKKTYHNVGTFPISNRKFVELEVKSIPLTHKYMTASLVFQNMFYFWEPCICSRHDIADMLLKLELRINQSINQLIQFQNMNALSQFHAFLMKSSKMYANYSE